MSDIGGSWLALMLRYCQLIADDEQLASAFNQNPDEMWTSVVSYNELIEQIFDDGDIEQALIDLRQSQVAVPVQDELVAFVRHLETFDSNLGNNQPDLQSHDWRQVQQSARKVITAHASGKLA